MLFRSVLAEHLDDTDIAKAKTRPEALKILRAKKQREHNDHLATQFKLTTSSESPHTLLHGDIKELLPTLPPESYNVLLTDPPYGIGAQSFGHQQFSSHEYDDTPETWHTLMEVLARESYRICTPQAHAYIFCDIKKFLLLTTIFTTAGWTCWSTPLIWYKGNQGLLPRPEHGPRRTYEAILFASKGDMKTQHVGHDVLTYQPPAKLCHAAEKPVALYADLLRRSTVPGNTIIDPFCGSGPIFSAAHRLSLSATGIDCLQSNIGLCITRMEDDTNE